MTTLHEAAAKAEPVAYRRKGSDGFWHLFHQATGWKDCSGFEPLFTHPAPSPVPTTRPLKPEEAEMLQALGFTGECVRLLAFNDRPKPAGERAELIARLRDIFKSDWGNAALREAADMLEADAQEIALYAGTLESRDRNIESLRAENVRLAQQVAVPDGWVLVPIDPTPAMSAAGFCVNEAEHDPAGVYRAMLAAAQGAKT